MTKKKKTPKNSNKKGKKPGEKQENIIILAIFIVFIAVVAYLFYFVNITSDQDTVAVVNGKEITREELDWWYKISIFPEDRDIITRQDFLILSLIPQEVLVQRAEKDGIKATENEVENLIGLYIIENGISLDEFEEHLNSRSITINDIKKSFETRTVITKLLEEENIDLIDDDAFKEYMDDLVNSSDIKIFPENIAKLVLISFEETGDEICDEEKPIVRLYTTSSCEICEETSNIFNELTKEFSKDEIIAYHWSLDEGDDLLTLKGENGVPKEEVAIFKKYSPDSLVPTIVLGCKYKRVGKLSSEEEDEFKTILKTLIS